MYDYQLILAKSFPAFRRAGFKWIVAYIVTVLLKRTIWSDNYELKDDFLRLRQVLFAKRVPVKQEVKPPLQYGLNRLFAEVRSGGGPVFRIFHEVSSNQSGVGICTGKYSYHTGTATDLPIQPFQHVGRRNLSCIQLWKSIERQRVLQTVFQAANGFGENGARTACRFLQPVCELVLWWEPAR